jgi:hypothetical protein
MKARFSRITVSVHSSVSTGIRPRKCIKTNNIAGVVTPTVTKSRVRLPTFDAVALAWREQAFISDVTPVGAPGRDRTSTPCGTRF